MLISEAAAVVVVVVAGVVAAESDSEHGEKHTELREQWGKLVKNIHIAIWCKTGHT